MIDHNPAPLVDFVVPCRDLTEPDGVMCPGEVRYGPGDMQARCTVCRGWRGRHTPGDAPGWVFVGDYPPAFTAVVAAHLEAHEDLDVQEIGARMRAATTTIRPRKD